MTLPWKIFEFVVAVIEVYLLYIFSNSFLEERSFKSIHKFLIFLLQASIIFCANFIFGVASPFVVITSIVTITINFIIIFKSNFIYILLNILTFLILISLFEFIGVLIVTSVFNVSTNSITQYTIYRAISSVLIRSLFFIFILILKKLKIKVITLKKVQIYEIIIVLLFSISLVISIFNLYKSEYIANTKKLVVFIISLATIIFISILIKIINEIIKFSQEEVEWKLRETEYKRQINYIKSMEDLTHSLRAQRHDFNHHIGCIYGLLQTCNVEDAKLYTENLVSTMQEINTIVNIDNAIIASILNFKFAIAKAKNIDLEVDVKIPKELRIDSTDISIILGNALDNAIEACEKCKEKNIIVKMYIQSDHLIIKICNNKNLDFINSSLNTTKEDKENHGFGIENIRYVVDKYDGLLKIEDLGDKFSINIAL
ncbi:sensor histidine kinase [Desnuesiella massiliensis]|uniref:sensor histidine kinase n=1 Tax=Desnuesiella massiliensis TaxID=1650662 RepID=UPI0006E1AF50|nr:sensor histidine kinase [Desnuesiella massiliensis]